MPTSPRGCTLGGMFGLRPKLPVSEEDHLWVDEGFRRLERMLGPRRMLDASVVLPTDEFFPDPYDKRETGVRALFRRVCDYMQVDPERVDLEMIPDESELMAMLPAYRHSSHDPAGLHYGETAEERALIGIKQSLLRDPVCVVATLAHELCHVILLDGGRMNRNVGDMEPMTDLATVFLGMGIFTANAANRFEQFQDNTTAGWHASRQGYLPELVYGYALARFAAERGEERPTWIAHLSTNVREYFRQSAAWLRHNARLNR